VACNSGPSALQGIGSVQSRGEPEIGGLAVIEQNGFGPLGLHIREAMEWLYW